MSDVETPMGDLAHIWPGPTPTPLAELPELAARCGVGRIFVKDESVRPLGNFKSLGGVYASLEALKRALGVSNVEAILQRRGALREWTLVCASDGNHGLAVAAAAQLVGADAHIYLPAGVSAWREDRLVGRGARVIRIAGTYDDAVDAAKAAARSHRSLLIADTSEDPCDLVSADILDGYDHLVGEIVQQLQDRSDVRITHAILQAGVGGLAAAVARGLAQRLTDLPTIVVVEPDAARCVSAALLSGRLERVPGDLDTSAEMLSCGQASAPALEILRRYRATAIGVDEAQLKRAVADFAAAGGPRTTPSGAAGLAGLRALRENAADSMDLGISEQSQILLIVSEGAEGER